MLNSLGSTERLKADKFMPFDPCGFSHLAERFRDVPHKAVRSEEDSQARWRRFLIRLVNLRGSPSQAPENQKRSKHDSCHRTPYWVEVRGG